ncbi:prolyl 4-hydroxylase subunit alpha-1-like isoform X2 [Stegodyphus dumicola]|nr:prolyl 4-hydroxylase subunit alpha-1-like isoform X2 [Stegodyphus dumicola]
MLVFSFTIWSVLLNASVNGELYSALAGLETLLDTQRLIIDTLDHYIELSESRIKRIKRLKEAYSYLLRESSANFQEFISNPINAFVLIKKLSTDWDETKKIMFELPKNDMSINSAVFPDQDDVSGAAKALLRVQQTYALETSPLSEGILKGETNGLPLSADDCFEMGRQAFHAGYYDYAISWLERSREKSIENNEGIRNSTEILKYLSLSTFEKGRTSLMLFTNSLLQLGYMIAPSFENGIFAPEKSLNMADSNNAFMTQTTVFDEAVYRTLCQAKKGTSESFSSQLRCKLVAYHPYLTLQPVKEEQLWKEPKISLFYDVISNSEIEVMKSLALPSLQRAEVAEYSGSLGHRVSDTRVTKIAWLREADHPLIPKMYQRIEDITGLSSHSAEPFQMANYGLGGHFHLHMDVLPDTERYFGPDMGNRIATWLLYLSDVRGGGATVFPRLNLSVWPKKGSALFWHNVKSNGVGNILTLHGACPVLSGSKWVSNVWFHERGQEFRLKCGMRPESSLLQANLSN